jgi:hypothetical protein
VESQKAIVEFLIATLPAVFLYFVGWGYLYFYFDAFGINISEINLDTSTVLIYAFSPISIAAKSYRIWLGPTIFAFAAAVVCFTALSKIMSRNARIRARLVYRRLTTGTALTTKLAVAMLLLIVVFMFFIPVLRWAAAQQRSRIWAGQAETIVPFLTEKTKSEEKAGPRLLTDPMSQIRESYIQCSAQEALLLIFADDKAYYVLCRSVESSNEGIVFEVRRETGLMSARFAAAGE